MLTRVRIEQAQRWLGDSHLPIAEIALRSGFSDQAALTRAMQRVGGITPPPTAGASNSLGKNPQSAPIPPLAKPACWAPFTAGWCDVR
ncbi:helix-turn-helix domain-containing protein [Pseudomonas qingdaonensis]|nr:helix-turn-helix domain-containing protein [Pseudomonas qingdaonensis]